LSITNFTWSKKSEADRPGEMGLQVIILPIVTVTKYGVLGQLLQHSVLVFQKMTASCASTCEYQEYVVKATLLVGIWDSGSVKVRIAGSLHGNHGADGECS
jgi:hypothetical protein